LSAPDGSVLTTRVVLYPPYASDVDYPPLKTPFNQLNIVHFDLIQCCDVFITFHRKTTFHTGTNFFNHFFIATKRFKLALEYHHVIKEYANRFVTMQYAFKNHTARNRTEFTSVEYFMYLCNTQDLFTMFRCQLTAHCCFHIINQLIDN